LQLLAEAHVAAPVAQEMYAWVMEQTPGLRGERVSEDQVDAFRAKYERRLPAGVAERLISFWRSYEARHAHEAARRPAAPGPADRGRA
jgi:hypothetical protein